MLTDRIQELIGEAIKDWYKDYKTNGYGISISDDIKKIRNKDEISESIEDVVYKLAKINMQMWHEQDGIRSDDDEELLSSIEKIHPLNQHRNDLIEEIDEIILRDYSPKEDGFSAETVLEEINKVIRCWHEEQLTEYQGDSQEDELIDMVRRIALINTIIWHEEDKVREKISENEIISAVRKMNILNKERNILVEKIDSKLFG